MIRSHGTATKPFNLAGALVAVIAMLLLPQPGAAAFPGPTSWSHEPAVQRPPVLAYYYIWYDQRSWNRAKTDYPVLGRYSSDQAEIMRQHIRWAKAAGISGFIVSWKNTDVLRPRLEQLVNAARAEDFKLSIIYQGLDFYRNPLPIDVIASDFDYLAEFYGNDPVFQIWDCPLVVWSGTWKFSREEIARVTTPRRDLLMILASEKSVDGYERIADLVDGDAYYWSSVDPWTNKSHEKKLVSMSVAVHERAGLWIAPAAPGFDARLVGGSIIVDRQEGQTLRKQFDAAFSSSPDAIGLISWNEFSENSQIEPSCVYGASALEVVASVLGGRGPEQIPGCMEATPVAGTAEEPPRQTNINAAVLTTSEPGQQTAPIKITVNSDADSSSPDGRADISSRLTMIGFVVFAIFACITVVAARSRRRYAASLR